MAQACPASGRQAFLPVLLAALLASLPASPGAPVDGSAAQSEPLARTYTAGATQSYRVELLVRSEIEGQRPVRVGVKDYTEPFARFVEARISWKATQRIASVLPDGSAEIEESLDGFGEPESRAATDGDPDLKNLAATLEDMLRRWSKPRVLHYVATRAGQARGLKPDGVPALDEAAPVLLTLWLALALRPEAVLPARPIRFGERWQGLRAVSLPEWADVQGYEAGEWLEAPGSGEPAVRLLVTQNISGQVASGKERSLNDGADSGVVSVAGRFHAESLSTVSLTDGHLLAATRSATREITWTLAPGKGSGDNSSKCEDSGQPPRFQARLSVQVTIGGCGDGCR